jgi:hypothetical protein
MAAKKL